jgi:hypothetical protein
MSVGQLLSVDPVISSGIDILPVGECFLITGLITIGPGIEFSNFNELPGRLGHHPSRLSILNANG